MKSLLRNILVSLSALLIVAGYGMRVAQQWTAPRVTVSAASSPSKKSQQEDPSASDQGSGTTKISAIHAFMAVGVCAPSPAILAERLAVSEPIFCLQTAPTATSHQVEGRFLLSYFFKLFKSAIQGMAP